MILVRDSLAPGTVYERLPGGVYKRVRGEDYYGPMGQGPHDLDNLPVADLSPLRLVGLVVED